MEVTSVAKLIVVNPASGKMLLIRRSATDNRRPGQWDIPGGMVEANEMLESAAVRECIEEAGIEITQEKIQLIYSDRHYFEDDKSKLVNWLVFYGLSEQDSVVLSSEHDEYKWVHASEAVSLLEYDRYKNAIGFLAEHRLIPELKA